MSDGVVVRVLSGRGSRAADREALVAFVADVTDTAATRVRVVRRCPHCGAADHGRPAAVADGHDLGVSLSRTTGVLALAVGPGPDMIGVDVERPSRVAAAGLDAFTPGERERAARSGSAAVHRTACWAVKEAVLKRDGRGLRVDPTEVDAVLDHSVLDHGALDHGALEHAAPHHGTSGPVRHTARLDGVVHPVTVLRLDEDLVLAVAADGAPVTVQDRRHRTDGTRPTGPTAAPAPRARRSTVR